MTSSNMRRKPQIPQNRFQNLSAGLGKVTTPYGSPTRYEKFHPGVDIANSRGTPIPAFEGGVVTGVRMNDPQSQGNYGNSVIVTDGDGDRHVYSHLNRGFVKIGQPVQTGQVLGEMGNTGASYSPSGRGDGSHLDYRIVDAYGRYKKPSQS